MLWAPNRSVHIEQVVASYSSYLLRHYGRVHQEKYEQRYGDNEEAAVAEAVVFSWLCSVDLNPKYNEDDLGKGGADFICQPERSSAFVIEATSLGSGSLSNQTGWTNEVGIGVHGGPFSLPTRVLQARVKAKVPQLSKHPMPRVLAILSSHIGADAFFSDEGATCLLVGGYEFCCAIGSSSKETFKRAKLENAVFIRRDQANPDRVVACRESVSAILLLALDGRGFSVVGILHPEPRFPIDPRTFPAKVPFSRLQPWPTNDKVQIEWTADTRPLSTRFELAPIPQAF